MIDWTKIQWERYPHLRKIFEHRPKVNVYWTELLQLAIDLCELEQRGKA